MDDGWCLSDSRSLLFVCLYSIVQCSTIQYSTVMHVKSAASMEKKKGLLSRDRRLMLNGRIDCIHAPECHRHTIIRSIVLTIQPVS